ncbi:MAG: hypothetical protein JWQ27_2324 [Ferruginibacter sp.]|nr:hypothetical protein [Ferruginibacter sp.]
MERFEFPKIITISTLEELQITLNQDLVKSHDFFVPVAFDHIGFGVLPQAIIIFQTWIRNCKQGDLIISVEIDDDVSLREFACSYLGYVILSCAWKHKEIINHRKEPLKGLFKHYTELFHKKIDFLQDLPNDSILIPFFDHYSKQKGLSHWFYNQNFQFAGSPQEIESSVYRIFSELGKIYRSKIVKNVKAIIDDLEIIIWELLKNTADHATKDHLNQVDLSPNTRGVFFKIHRSSKKNFIQISKSHSGLQNYLSSMLQEGDNFLLEITVYDTGPGMVKRYCGEKWNNNTHTDDEVSIIKKCLCKGLSSAPGLKGTAKGYGLNNVLMTLSEKQGFLQIRTGRTNLYRDLAKAPHFATSDYTSIELQDVTTNSPSTFSTAPESIGTIVTMFYPLK